VRRFLLQTYIIRSNGEKALDYVSTCIKDEYPAYCDKGDKAWFSAAMANGQAALGTSWAKVGTLLDGSMVRLPSKLSKSNTLSKFC